MSKTDWTDEHTRRLVELWDTPLTVAEIAARLGVSKGVVSGRSWRMSLPPRARRTPAPAPRARANKRRATPAPGPPPPPPPPPQEGGGVACVKDLTRAHCRWPYGEPGDPDFRFCGRPRSGLGPYCAGHAALSRAPNKTKIS